MKKASSGDVRLAVLKPVSKEAKFASISLEQEVIVIGRSKGDVILDDSEMSSSHCKIQTIGKSYHLFDLNSTNGTYVNGQKVLKARLNSGDHVKLGSTEFVFLLVPMALKNSVLKEMDFFKVVHSSPDKLSLDALKIDALLEDEKNRYLSSPRLILQVTYSDKTKETIEIESKSCVIGRSTKLGRFYKDEEISRQHARISLNEKGEVEIEDLGSTNGTLVNNEKIESSQLVQQDDLVRIGDSYLRVRISSAFSKSPSSRP